MWKMRCVMMLALTLHRSESEVVSELYDLLLYPQEQQCIS